MQQPRYRHDPTMAQVPLDVEEVLELIAERPREFTRNDEQVWVFVQRAQATAAALRHQSQQFDLETQARSAAMPSSGIPGNISPEQAARFLSPKQLVRLFDTYSREQLEVLERRQQVLQRLCKRLEDAIEQLRMVGSESEDDDALPANVRAALRNAVAALDTVPPEESRT